MQSENKTEKQQNTYRQEKTSGFPVAVCIQILAFRV
jgi:hypothetical protein